MPKDRSNPCKTYRRGSIAILAAFLMVLVFSILAFSVDIGLLYVNRAELQRSADAAAIAATNQLLEQQLLNQLVSQSSTEAR